MNDIVKTLKEQQKKWADRQGKALDGNGYLSSVEENLYKEMEHPTKTAFEQNDRLELCDSSIRPARMKAPHSSVALMVNVFDYWIGRDCGPIQQALGIETPVSRILCGQQYKTGLPGKQPRLDVVIITQTRAVLALECKFTEWLNNGSDKPFENSYFEGGSKRWRSVGLPKCQQLAQDMNEKKVAFRHLDAAQLLKQVLGLARKSKNFSLGYIYFDAPGLKAEAHLEEIETFRAQVGAELGFRAHTYQELFGKLKNSASESDADYLGYLEDRYFPQRRT